jgi:NAD(P)-dependent dehydrogenase (short-subunit alcohol dehydrogenase family)
MSSSTNAGVGSTHKPLQDTTEQEWDAVVNLNLRGVYFCTKFAISALRKTNGNIVLSWIATRSTG